MNGPERIGSRDRRAGRALGGFSIAVLAIYFFISTAPAAAQAVQYISPLPGSTMVSQTSAIILKTRGSLEPGFVPDVSAFSVTGSQSGVHSGKVIVSDDLHTMIFEPFTTFAPGEEIAVNLRQGIRTADGADIGPLTFHFSVSPLSSLDQASLLSRTTDAEMLRGAAARMNVVASPTSLGKTQNDTLPTGFPTPVLVHEDNPSVQDYFLGTFRLGSVGGSIQVVPSNEQYLMIVDDAVKPIFYRTIPPVSTDFKLQPNGKLTYYDGKAKVFYELDSSYAVVDSFMCGYGYQTDVHELLLLPNGHALLLGLDPEYVDMSSIVQGGYPAATVIGMIIQELDKDKNVVFEWRTFDHFRITDATHEDLTARTIDYVHANSIDVDTDGNLLLSSRHLDEITKINRQTGDIIWRMGGKNNQFSFTNDTVGFSHQHSARRTPSGTIVMFDDGNFHTPQVSRAVEYSMDTTDKTVTQVWQYRHTPDTYAFAMGSVERLSNGNTVIGWGMSLDVAVTEVRPNGSVAFELRLPDSVVSYRALSFPWRAASTVTDTQSGNLVPASFSLEQNYPNPFNPSTVIRYSVPRQTNVSLRVYDLIGREVANLVDEAKPAGAYSVRFDALRYASGVYFYRLTTSDQSLTKMMTLLK
jgi:hypothetical protein